MKRGKDFFKSAIALLLTSLLFFSYVVKPVHVLIVHHDLASRLEVPSENAELSIPNHHDCSICNFEFCSFIDHEKPKIPSVVFTLSQELGTSVPAAVQYYSARFFSLRAPPAI
jgi:hypothetical protein